jgi:hypothetical protein
MSLPRAVAQALAAAVLVVAYAALLLSMPVYWALLIGLAVGAVTLTGSLFAGAYDADWVSEPDPVTANVTSHASELTERLHRAGANQFRFTSRVQPRLRRLAVAALGEDLNTEEAREKLGADLHRLLTDPAARLPDPKTFAALVRRLEDLC